MTFASSIVFILFGPLTAAYQGDESALRPEEPRFTIEVFGVVLTDVPVERVVITARGPDGKVDSEYNGRPLIQGLKLADSRREDSELPRFQKGVLDLRTDLRARRRVYVTGDEIIVDPTSRRRGYLPVRRIFRWLSVVPPLAAILLAIWLKNVIIAIFAGVWSGAVILAHGNFFAGFVRTLDVYLLDQLSGNKSHMMIILFTLFLGAMIGVMARSGGTMALVSSLTRYTKTREQGQLMTWFLGLVVFFDDYANTLLVGSTMRPVTDRLRISREKLAFLVDSTAAPVAGLAVISTWVGVEIGYIADTFQRLDIPVEDVYMTFLYTIPYRFYPLHLLVFVWLIAYSGNDYGPMLKAEARALSTGEVRRGDVAGSGIEDDEEAASGARRRLLRNALIPVASLLVFILVGLWWTGSDALYAANLKLRESGEAAIPASFQAILQHASPNRVLFLASFVASLFAIVSAKISRSLTLPECMEAWLEGAKSMFLAVVILVLAWGVAAVCDDKHLNTAGFIVELTRGHLSVNWMPTLAFLVAGCVAFATGSSWSTMGLLMPLFISITFNLLVGLNQADPNHRLMLATIGAVLAGAIFGDHCSPISDTTVLSSASAGVDHLDHVATQMPYAISVALVSLLFGYIPVGFGQDPIVLLPLGLVVLYLLVQFLGRPVEDYAKRIAPAKDAPPSLAVEGTGEDADGHVPPAGPD